MNKWLRRAAGTVGLAGGMIALASGAAQADAPTPSAALPGNGFLHNLFTPLAGANLGLSVDVPGTRVDAGLLPDGPLALVPNDGRVGVTAHTLTKGGMPQDVFFTGKLPDVLKIVPIDGLLPPGVVGPVLNAGAGALGNVSNTVADTTRTVSGFNSPAMGVHALTADAARTLVGESTSTSTEEGLPIVGPLLGNLPIVGGLLGDGGPLSSLPIVGGLLGGDNAGGGGLPLVGSLPVVGGLTQSLPGVGGPTGESTSTSTEEGLPIVGPLLGNLPIVGGLLGDGGPLSSLPIVGGLLGGDSGGGGLPAFSSLPVVGGLTQALPGGAPTGEATTESAAEEGLPLVGPLLGGLPVVGGLLGDGGPLGSLPIVGGLLGGGGGAGGGLPSVGSLPFVGGAVQSLPVVGDAVQSLPVVGGESATEGLPLVGPLLGNLPVVGGLLGDGGPLGSLPIVGGLLGGGGGTPQSLPFVGGVTDAVGTSIPQATMTASDTVDDLVTPAEKTTEDLPIVGGLIGNLPIVGGLIGNLPIVGGLITNSGAPGGIPFAGLLDEVPVVGGLTQGLTGPSPASTQTTPTPAVAPTTPKPAAHAAPTRGRHAAPETPTTRAFGDPAATGQRPIAPGFGPTLGDPTTEGLPIVGSLPLVGPLIDGATGGGLPVVGSLPVVGPLLGGGGGGGSLINSLPVPLTLVQSLPIVGALVP